MLAREPGVDGPGRPRSEAVLGGQTESPPGPHRTRPPVDPEVVTEDVSRFEPADVGVGGGGWGVVGMESVSSSRSATSLAGRMETGIRALMCSPTC